MHACIESKLTASRRVVVVVAIATAHQLFELESVLGNHTARPAQPASERIDRAVVVRQFAVCCSLLATLGRLDALSWVEKFSTHTHTHAPQIQGRVGEEAIQEVPKENDDHRPK